MVWGGITVAGRTALHVVAGRVTGQYYRDNILAVHVVPFARGHGAVSSSRMTMQDVTGPGLLQVTSNNRTLPWPALSPDLSSIEHVWDMLGQRLRQRQQRPANVQELAAALQQEWDNLDQNDLRRLIMPRRINACLANRGGFTRY
ncbi:hypothetical protein SNE40_018231 [Patella caerulea]